MLQIYLHTFITDKSLAKKSASFCHFYTIANAKTSLSIQIFFFSSTLLFSYYLKVFLIITTVIFYFTFGTID